MIAVIDYGIGNLRSAEKAFQHVGAAAMLVDDPRKLEGASGVVLPGVGSFGRCAEALDRGGWRGPIEDIVASRTPFLGICVGFQLLFEASEESPGAQGLGLLDGSIVRLDPSVKHPQIQWNRVETSRPNLLLPAQAQDRWMYFVHSYAASGTTSVVATCDYGGSVVAAVESDMVFGVQFHPEKSGTQGLELLARFASICEPPS